jgi:hypothetical protein
MLLLTAIAVISLLVGILFLVREDALEKVSKALNRVIVNDQAVARQHSKSLGIFLIIFAAILFFLARRIGR